MKAFFIQHLKDTQISFHVTLRTVWGYIFLFITLVYLLTHGGFMPAGRPDSISILKIVLLVFAFLISILFFHVQIQWDARKEQLATRILLACSPVFCYLFLELTHKSNFYKFHPYDTFMNLLLLAFLCIVCIVIVNRFRIAMILPVTICFLFALANTLVYRFRGFPLLASDFTLIKSAAAVADNYDYTISYTHAFMLILFVDYILFVCKLKNNRIFDKCYLLKRLIVLGSTLIIAYVVILASKLTTDPFVHISQFKPQNSYRDHGAALTLVGSIHFTLVVEPDDYSPEAAAAIADGYTSDSASAYNIEKAPDIIVIMNEAFSDYQTLYDLNIKEDTLSFFHSLTDDTISGNMYVSIWGSQTANTEYEFLTGNSKAFLPAGVAPYQTFIKSNSTHHSLVHSMTQIGYGSNFAMHSFTSVGYNRTVAYKVLGFEDFITMERFENPWTYRDYISDQCHYENLISHMEEVKETKDGPVFAFNVTMQNHSAYKEVYDNLPLTLKVKNAEYRDKLDLRTYVNLLKKTDEAYEYLIDYYSKQEDPVMIVFFGDHQPSIEMYYDENDEMQKYQIPFKIWTNYDIEEQYIEKTSPNYLGAIMTQAAGLPLTGYQKFLLELSEEVPAITVNGYYGSNGKLYETEDVDSPYYDRIHEYNLLEYNSLFDDKNVLRDFFYLNE